MQNQSKRKPVKIITVLLIALLATGCIPPQNDNTLERLALIIGIGIDVDPNDPDTYIFTTTNPVFEELGELESVEITTTGPSLEVALRNWQYQRHRKFALGKLGVVMFGNDLMEAGLKEITTEMRQIADVNVLAQVVYFPGDPHDAWSITPPSDPRRGVVLMEILETLFQEGLTFEMSICDLNTIIQNPDKDAFMPRLEITEDESRFYITGMAILNQEGKLATVLNDAELLTFLLLADDAEGAMLSTKVEYEGQEAIASFEVKRHGRSRKKVTLEDNKPQIAIRIPLEVEIISIRMSGIELVTREFIESMEQQISNELARQAHRLIAKMQSNNSDPLGLGQWVRIQQTSYHNQGTWRDDYPNADIRVNFDVKVSRVNVVTEMR